MLFKIWDGVELHRVCGDNCETDGDGILYIFKDGARAAVFAAGCWRSAVAENQILTPTEAEA